MALSVFPEQMDKIDPEDVNASLRTLESYIRYIVERVEFSMTNTFRTTTGLGSSAQAVALVLEEQETKLANLQSGVSNLTAALGDKADQTALDALDRRVYALEHPDQAPDPEEQEGGN